MALTDTDLLRLRRQLDDDPESEVFLDTARELVERRDWALAVQILSRALEVHADVREGWALLVRAAVEGGDFQRALEVLARIAPTPEREPTLTRFEIRARVGVGQIERATELAKALVLLHPHLGPVDGLLATPTLRDDSPSRVVPLPDRFISLDRATAYVQAGRPDRALRVLRRLAYHFPDDRHLRARLQELVQADPADGLDDLSEELPDPDRIAAPLRMPRSGFDHDVDNEITQPAIDIRALRRLIEEANDPGEEDSTALMKRPVR